MLNDVGFVRRSSDADSRAFDVILNSTELVRARDCKCPTVQWSSSTIKRRRSGCCAITLEVERKVWLTTGHSCLNMLSSARQACCHEFACNISGVEPPYVLFVCAAGSCVMSAGAGLIPASIVT